MRASLKRLKINFDFASANFYTCFLAALHAEKYADLLWPDFQRGESILTESIRLKKAVRPKTLLQLAKVSSRELLLLNPDLDRAFRHNRVLPKGFRLLVPRETKHLVSQAIAAL